MSNGMMFAPLANIGVPLTLKPKLPSLRISSTVRRPIRRVTPS